MVRVCSNADLTFLPTKTYKIFTKEISLSSDTEKQKTFHLIIRFLTKEVLDVHGVLNFSVDQDRKTKDIHYVRWTYTNGRTQSVTSTRKGGIKSFIVKEEKS